MMIMRPFLPVTLMCCLLAARLAAGTRDTFATTRALLAKPVVNPAYATVPLTRTQFVQATWALKGVTCTQVNAASSNFNNTLANAMIDDIKAALVLYGWPAAVPFVRARRQPCMDFEVSTSLPACS
jgi:hypothetical protein